MRQAPRPWARGRPKTAGFSLAPAIAGCCRAIRCTLGIATRLRDLAFEASVHDPDVACAMQRALPMHAHHDPGLAPSARPAISIVMPAYNRAACINLAIDSVLAQTFTDFELVVIDDCSTDGTADMVEARADSRVRCVRQPSNTGPSAARNRGVHAARAPLIAFLDSDDRFLPHKLDFVTRYFESHRDVDALIDSFEVVYPDAMPWKRNAPRSNPDLRNSRTIERAVFARKVYKATPALTARKHTLIEAGLFDEALRSREDMDLVVRLTHTARCATTSEVLWTKYWTRGSLSTEQGTFVSDVIEICRRHPNYLTDPDLRPGLARDEARHVLRRLVRGQLRRVARDLRHLEASQGVAETRALLVQGMGEILRRAWRGKTAPTRMPASPTPARVTQRIVRSTRHRPV